MPHDLDDGVGVRAPSIKLRNVGDHIDAAVVNIKQVPRKIYGTNEYKRKPDGSIAMQLVVTAINVGGNAVIDDGAGGDRPVEPGEVIAVFVAGRDRWDREEDAKRPKGAPKSWSSAKDDLGRKLQTGDVFRFRFDEERPGQGAQPRKIRTFVFREPRPDEADQTRRCDELYEAGTLSGDEGSNGGDAEPEEDPF